jgi:hypothetical protein
MADFRKWFMVIAVVLLAAATASAATSSTTSIACNATSQPTNIRLGGVTEYIGEVDLVCDATQVHPPTPGGYITAQFQLAVDATITNMTSGKGSFGPLSMSGAAVMFNTAPQSIFSTVQGQVVSAGVLYYPNVILPTGTTFTIRFINVRVLSTGGEPNQFNSSDIVAAVTANLVNPTGFSVDILGQTGGPQGNALVVAHAQTPLKFAVTDCTGKPATANITFQQCVNYDLNDSLGTNQLTPIYGVTFTELEPYVFKNITQEDGQTLPNPSMPSTGVGGTQICDTGHLGIGDVAPAPQDPPPPAGSIPVCADPLAYVTNGTRLLAQWLIPPALVGKVHVWVTQWQTASTSATATAELTTNDSGAYNGDLGWGNDIASYDLGPFVTNCAGTNGRARNRWVELQSTTGTATASWEIVTADTSAIEGITFGWAITYDESELPSLPVGQAYAGIVLSGALGPIASDVVPGATTTPAQDPKTLAVTGEPVVRFIAGWQAGAATINIDHCVTNLLFPYVTNVVGFETGLAIANTSLDSAWNLTLPPSAPTAPANGPTAAIPNWGTVDTGPLPYNTTPQAGPCNLFLFGSASAVNMTTGTKGGSAVTPVVAIASITTPNIAAGQVFADTLTSIFGLNAGTAPVTLTGYVIARCDFQFGHGYAFLVNPVGAPQGYLALIIPDRSILNGDTLTGTVSVTPVRVAQPFSNAIFDEQGEVLGL